MSTRRLGSLLVLGAALALIPLAPRLAHAAPEDREAAGVVSMRVVYQSYDPGFPWNKAVERTSVGNAVVVAGRRLLTTADLVRDANLILVRKFGRYPDFPARAVRVDFELDLALLTVDDPAFWEGLTPLPIETDPLATGRFQVNRWRLNGRFEQGSGEVVDYPVTRSRYGAMEVAVLRGNAAMAGLGWAEVLTHQGKVIGLINGHEKQEIQAATGNLLRLFVEAAAREPYRGFAHRGFGWQRLNNAGQRKFFGLTGQNGGILVRQVYSGGVGSEELQTGDILLSLGGYRIDPEGHIDHPRLGGTLFTAIFNESLAENLSVTLLRNGRRMALELPRRRFTPQDYRIPPYPFRRRIDYEVFGGMVMQELSVNYLRAWGGDWEDKAPRRLIIELVRRSRRRKGDPPERIVFISRVLQDPTNLGYEGAANAFVKRVNGRPVHSLVDLRAALKEPQGEFHLLELMSGHERTKLAYRAREAAEANRRIRARYGIPDEGPRLEVSGGG